MIHSIYVEQHCLFTTIFISFTLTLCQKKGVQTMDMKQNTSLEPSHETVAFGENSTVLIWRNSQNQNYAPHWHTALEVIIPLENDYHVTVNETHFHLLPDEILIIPPGEIHALHAPETGFRNIYLIDISFLTKIRGFASIQSLLSQFIYITQASHPKIHKSILNQFLEIADEYFRDNEYSEITVYSSLLKILAELGYYRTQGNDLFVHCRIDKKKEYIQKLNIVLDFIDENYMEHICLQQIAAMAGFSKYHFSRLFTQYTGRSFCDYLNLRRIHAAEILLSDDNFTITETAMQSGFSSIATFNRVFKFFKNCSPSEYRNLKSFFH